jgi:hypothetical protein
MSLKDYTKNNNSDQIGTRLASLGLKLPESLKVPPDIQTPFAWVRIRGNQEIRHIFQAMDHKILMGL